MKYYTTDIETVSDVNLGKEGVMNYALHPSTFMRNIAVQCPDTGKIYTHGLNDDNAKFFTNLGSELREGKAKLVAHNWIFEYAVMSRDLPDLKPEHFVCTRALSQMLKGPGSLAQACLHFGMDYTKTDDSAMKKTMTTEGYEKYNTPELEQEVQEYCNNDVKVTAELFNILRAKIKDIYGDFLPYALEAEKLTRDMNRSGVCVDQERLEKMIKAKSLVKEEFNTWASSNFDVEKGTQNRKITAELQERGAEIKGLNKEEVAHFLASDASEDLKSLVRRYSELNRTSLSKVDKAKSLLAGGRLYGMFAFCGAAETGRWSSLGLNLQNLPRPTHKIEEVNDFFGGEIEHYKPGLEDITQSAIRTLLVPEENSKFFVADLAQIEGRLALYRSGHGDTVAEMAAGIDKYRELAAKIHNKTMEEVTDDERFIGKTAMLSLQYGQGVQKFYERTNSTAPGTISKAKAEIAHSTYHQTYPGIRRSWEKLDSQIHRNGNGTTLVKLKTGRKLEYPDVRFEMFKYKTRDGLLVVKEGWRYRTKDGRTHFWGGSLFNHVIQGEARDVLLFKMLGMKKMGYDLRMTVHDEVIYNVPADADEDKIKADWEKAGAEDIERVFPGLKLNSDMQFTNRYYK